MTSIATHRPFVFTAMGTVVSVHTALPLAREAEDAVLEAFAVYEDRFSLYRPETEASGFARREFTLRQASPQFQAVYTEAVLWRGRTDGAFTPHRPDGVVDLSGVVKALAIQAAGEALGAHGVQNWCLNAGGDVLTDGVQADGSDWMVGIVDPDDRAAVLTQVPTAVGRRAVATSGLAERGDHVWRLGSDDTFRQVTVCAADIVTADVLATAILAGGPSTLHRVQGRFDIDVLACGRDIQLWASPAFVA